MEANMKAKTLIISAAALALTLGVAAIGSTSANAQMMGGYGGYGGYGYGMMGGYGGGYRHMGYGGGYAPGYGHMRGYYDQDYGPQTRHPGYGREYRGSRDRQSDE
jgi:hypothetical protein